jgi:hypothetical protein
MWFFLFAPFPRCPMDDRLGPDYDSEMGDRLEPGHHPLISLLVSSLWQFNRLDRVPSPEALRAQLSDAGKSGWTFVDLLADFHLLLFLTDLLDMSDVEGIAQCIMDRSKPLAEGHVELIRAYAGM